MSYCIDFHQASETICIDNSHVDIDKLKSFLEEVNKQVTKDNCFSDDIDWKLRIGYWFLNNMNVSFTEDSVLIILGHARSSHTWRDIKGTMKLIYEFLHDKEYPITLIVEDIDAGDQKIGRVTFPEFLKN